MSGEELKKKLDNAGISQAEIARRLGVATNSVWQYLNADNVKSGILEDICKAFGKDMGFFYEIHTTEHTELNELRTELESLRQENAQLKAELRHQQDPDKTSKESLVYELWMEHMKIEKMRSYFDNRMQEMYQKILEG